MVFALSAAVAGGQERAEMSDDGRLAVYNQLLTKATKTSTQGEGSPTVLDLPRGAIKEIAGLYGVSNRTVQRIWGCRNIGDTHEENPKAARKQRRRNSGRKRTYPELESDALKALPLRKRRTLRDVDAATEYNRSTVGRMAKR